MEHANLFGTPFFAFDLSAGADALNRELAARLCREAATVPGVKRSNHGGWHSTPDLAQRSDDCYRQVSEAVLHHVQISIDRLADDASLSARPAMQFGLQGWAMVMDDGAYSTLHNHAQAHWSVVYYVDAGESDHDAHPMSGGICFVDPRRDVNLIPGLELFPSTHTVIPKAGMLIVFPGWLQHYVHPFRGKGPRVSLAYNVSMRLTHAG
jgi:uncharacterized protein (TIGR02466 family)